jgi:hypothetical protein
MIALFSALLGFFGSAFPDFIKLFRDGRERAHELALLKLQIEYDREKLASQKEQSQAEYAYKLQEITLQTQVAERQTLNEGAGTREGMLGIHWVDALSGSVRPVITYCFFGLYALVKTSQFYLLMHPTLPWVQGIEAAQALLSVWNEEDMGIFSAVIAFWFGSRALGKYRKAT